MKEKDKNKEKLEVDLSQLSEEDQKEVKTVFPWQGLLVLGIIVTLMVICIIVIVYYQGLTSA